jgi:hypothetical protein
VNCPKCGWTNPDDAAKCANCMAELAPGQPQPTQQMPQQPYVQQPCVAGGVSDFMTWSIVVTVIGVLFCNLVSLVLGIIGIVKSSSARSKTAAGDQAGAAGEANTAKILCIIATCLLVVGLIFAIPFWIGVLHGYGSFGRYSPHY